MNCILNNQKRVNLFQDETYKNIRPGTDAAKLAEQQVNPDPTRLFGEVLRQYI